VGHARPRPGVFGHLERLLGITSAGAAESTLPLLMTAFGSGLSMDYEVFLRRAPGSRGDVVPTWDARRAV